MELLLVGWLLFALFVLLPVGVVITVVVAGTRSFRRANRVAPRVPTQVPNLWRYSIGMGARLHRRLQRIAALARSAGAAAGGGLSIGELAADVERQACGLDDQLALARHLPTGERIRRQLDLERSVAELEQLALRITVLAGQLGSGHDERAVPLAERVRHLEEAVAEVRAVEAEALGRTPGLDRAAWLPPSRTVAPQIPEPVRRAGA